MNIHVHAFLYTTNSTCYFELLKYDVLAHANLSLPIYVTKENLLVTINIYICTHTSMSICMYVYMYVHNICQMQTQII